MFSEENKPPKDNYDAEECKYRFGEHNLKNQALNGKGIVLSGDG